MIAGPFWWRMGYSSRFRAGLQLTAVLSLLALLAVRDPNNSGSYPTCPFRLISGGLLCPGCGSMRMLYAVIHGQLLEAVRLNPFAFVFLPLLGWLVLGLVVTVFFGQRLAPLRARTGIIWLFFVTIIIYTALRNVFPWLTSA